MRGPVTFLVILLLSACSGSDDDSSKLTYQGNTMGTYYRVSIVDANNQYREPAKSVALEGEIKAVFEAVNQSMSTYIEDSEVGLINRAKAGQTITVSEPLKRVLNESIRLFQLTDGAFDITVAPLVRLWGFGPDGSIDEAPDKAQLQLALNTIGTDKLRLSGNKLIKSLAETEIDLSAIAKGFAIDQLAEVLAAKGIQDWLIDVGGELRAKGKNKERAWRIGIETPTSEGGVQEIIELNDIAIATSGNYRNFLTLNGQNFGHIIDLDSGTPIQNDLGSVSVLHQSAMTADALATALMAMSFDTALAFAKEQGLSVYLIKVGGKLGELSVVKTGGFEATRH